MQKVVADYELDERFFLELLDKLIGETYHLQNRYLFFKKRKIFLGDLKLIQPPVQEEVGSLNCLHLVQINRPPEFIPEEDRAGLHILSALEPFKVENGGPLRIKHIHYAEKRKPPPPKPNTTNMCLLLLYYPLCSWPR